MVLNIRVLLFRIVNNFNDREQDEIQTFTDNSEGQSMFNGRVAEINKSYCQWSWRHIANEVVRHIVSEVIRHIANEVIGHIANEVVRQIANEVIGHIAMKL